MIKKIQPKLSPKKNKIGSTDWPKHIVRALMVALEAVYG